MDKIFNGDCLEVLKTLPDDLVDLVLTDPPYEMNMKTSASSELNKRFNNVEFELQDLDIIHGFNEEILAELVRVCKNINMYFWCNKAQLPMYFKLIEQYNCSFDIIKWVKTNPGPAYNNKYMSDTEYCVLIRGGAYGNH